MLVVDDHSLILEGICRLVSKMPEVAVVDALTSGVEAAGLIAKRDYDLYILDVRMPDISGFDLIARIREVNEHARIIVNTMHEQVWIINRLAQSGVIAVILKSSTASELVNAIHAVLRGEPYACPGFTSIYKGIGETGILNDPENCRGTESERGCICYFRRPFLKQPCICD